MSDPRLALLSVSDRTGLVEFARALVGLGFGLVSTGGTAQHLSAAGLAVTNVSDLTGFPEVFGGRVKTLHPKLFGGILFDRSEERDRGEASAHGASPIDLVVVNLYRFEEAVAKGRESGEGAWLLSLELMPRPPDDRRADCGEGRRGAQSRPGQEVKSPIIPKMGIEV